MFDADQVRQRAKRLKTRMGIDRRNSQGAMRGPAGVGRTVAPLVPPDRAMRREAHTMSFLAKKGMKAL